MGNENKTQKGGDVTVKMNHPKFDNAKLVNEQGQRRLLITTGVDEKEYQKWKKDYEGMRPSPEYLMLPTRNDFKRKGLCGDSGSLTVSYFGRSLLFPTTATCYRSRSITAGGAVPGSRRRNSGTFC